jgi:hypothetical protein
MRRAISTRNFSPFDNTLKGRIHAGMVLNPTDWQIAAMSLIATPLGKSSMTDFALHSSDCGGPKTRDRIEDLPQPDGPTMSPMFQAKYSMGNSPLKAMRHFCSAGQSNMAESCCTRAVSSMSDSTVKSMAGTAVLQARDSSGDAPPDASPPMGQNAA